MKMVCKPHRMTYRNTQPLKTAWMRLDLRRTHRRRKPEFMNNTSEDQKHTLGMWFRSLRRTSRVVLIVAVIASVALVAYAASVLFGTAHQSTNLSKDRYITVQLSGAEASGSVRPGSTVSLAPTLTNNGDINTTALMRGTVPVVNGSSAYDYEVNSSWTLVDADDTAGIYVYGFGSDSELNGISPGSSTDPLTSAFTMKSSITGAEFNGMGSVDISIDGYLVDSEAGTDPVSVWGMVGK